MPEPKPAARFARLRQVLPILGTVLLLGWFFASTDLAAVADNLRRADLVAYAAVVVVTTLAIWLYDSLCLVWLVRVTLGQRGRPAPVTLAAIAPIKAASYVLNILNYHAATLGVAWLVGRRKGVPFLEAAGALAALGYIDLVAVTAMAVLGLVLAPDVVGLSAGQQQALQGVAAGIFGAALLTTLLLQSGWRLPLLVRLRQLAVLRPLSALGPWQMVQGVLLRSGLVLGYTASAYLIMRTFGMTPDWPRMFVAVPIITVVGTLPISVSGLGTTQMMMRSFYAPFVTDGRDPQFVVDAFSTCLIVGYISCRLLVAAPFLRSVLAELRSRTEQDS